jgi:hypothetical protein
MVSKTIGYVLAGIGIIGLASWSFPAIREAILGKSTAFAQISGSILLIASVVLVAAGVLILYKAGGSSQKGHEVPIYEGEGSKRKIVGYRVLKK